MRGCRRWRRERLALLFRGRKAPGHEPDRSRLHISLAAGDLAGKAQPRHRLEPQRGIEELGRIEKRVAMQSAEPSELGSLQCRNAAEDARLLTVLELGLEADHVEQAGELVVLPQLHDGIR